MARGRYKPAHDTLELCDRAATMLKACGFEFRNVSRRSEACYYGLPGRKELIRIATHARMKKQNGEATHVVARLTFRGGCLTGENQMRLSEEKFTHMVEMAIGRYHLACATPKD